MGRTIGKSLLSFTAPRRSKPFENYDLSTRLQRSFQVFTGAIVNSLQWVVLTRAQPGQGLPWAHRSRSSLMPSRFPPFSEDQRLGICRSSRPVEREEVARSSRWLITKYHVLQVSTYTPRVMDISEGTSYMVRET